MFLALSPANDFRVVRIDLHDPARARSLVERWARKAFAAVRGRDPILVTDTNELTAYDDDLPMPEGWTQEDVRLREGARGIEVSLRDGAGWTEWRSIGGP